MKTISSAFIRASLLLFLAFGVALLLSCVIPNIRVNALDFTSVGDGVYEGFYDGVLSSARVRLSVRDGKLIVFELLSLESGLGEPAKAIADRVLDAQSLAVDAVSGATYSSRVILKAAELALSSAPLDAIQQD